jgi:hypothetical protein
VRLPRLTTHLSREERARSLCHSASKFKYSSVQSCTVLTLFFFFMLLAPGPRLLVRSASIHAQSCLLS